MNTRPGFTLLEATLVLAILGILLAAGGPLLLNARDAVAVRGARGELAGAVAVTRAAAIRSGGASLIIDTASGDVVMETAGGVRLPTSYPLGARYGVVIDSDRTTPVTLRYDALGIGRMTSAVIRLQRGRARATITVSAYGRVRT
jgi:prepilin-type N-terminal cleavage/methylation domain-containing protein